LGARGAAWLTEPPVFRAFLIAGFP